MQVCKYFELKHFLPKSYLAQTFANRAYSAACASSELLRACFVQLTAPFFFWLASRLKYFNQDTVYQLTFAWKMVSTKFGDALQNLCDWMCLRKTSLLLVANSDCQRLWWTDKLFRKIRLFFQPPPKRHAAIRVA